MEKNMKQILFKYFMLITCVFVLSSCGYLLSFGQLMFDGSCADWNCSKPTQRWTQAVHACYDLNFEIAKQKLGYENLEEVQDSEIGRNIYNQCVQNAGKYDIRKDKQYGHLFADCAGRHQSPA